MQSRIAVLLLVGLVFMAVFGATAMRHHETNGQACAASAAMGISCMDAVSPLASIALHIRTFTLFADGAARTMLTLLVLCAGLVLAAILNRGATALALVPVARLRGVARNSLQHKRRLDSWLALLEKRDPNPAY